MSTPARLFRLLSLLQVPRAWGGNELAERLQVSTRTIRNDVDRLRALGYPVHGVPGVAGGYRLGAGAEMPPLVLDDDEAVAVSVGLRTAANGALTGIEETSVRALAKIETVLPSRLRRRVAALAAATVSVQEPVAQVDPAVLVAIAGAIRDRQRLRIDYRSTGREVGARQIEPYRLVHLNRHWYLAAWDAGRSDWRTFRVDRLTLRPPHGARFAPRQLPASDMAAWVAQGVSTAAIRVHARVRLEADAETIAHVMWPDWGAVEAIDQRSCVFSTGGSSLDTIAVYLGLLGVDFEILEPPELIEHVRALGARYVRAAGQSTAPPPGP